MATSSKRFVLIATILAVSMTTIDQTIVAICGPEIQTSLGISHISLQWAINAYIPATAASLAFGAPRSPVSSISGRRR